MKFRLQILIGIGIYLGCIGCTTIEFATPQPKNQTALKRIPKELRGTYVNDDGDTIFVAKKGYRFPESFSKAIPLTAIDSLPGIRFVNNKLYDASVPTDKPIPYTRSNDTLSYEIQLYPWQTLSDSLILKPLNDGGYALNMQQESGWLVILIEPTEEGNLKLFGITEAKSKLEEFTEEIDFKKIDEYTYQLDLSAEEFEAMRKKGLFNVLGNMKRIN